MREMPPYFHHPVIRVLLLLGITFFLGSLILIAAHSLRLDAFLFAGNPSPARSQPTDVHPTLFRNLPYADKVNHRIWFFQKLDISAGKAQDIEIHFQDEQGHDLKEYLAHEATWNGRFWTLSGVLEVTYGSPDKIKKDDTLDLPDVTTPPSSFADPH